MLIKQHYGYLMFLIKFNYLLATKILQKVQLILLQLIVLFTQ